MGTQEATGLVRLTQRAVGGWQGGSEDLAFPFIPHCDLSGGRLLSGSPLTGCMVWGQELGEGAGTGTRTWSRTRLAGSYWNTNAVKRLEFQVLPLELVGGLSRRRPPAD